jgi:hypothetical protein
MRATSRERQNGSGADGVRSKVYFQQGEQLRPRIRAAAPILAVVALDREPRLAMDRYIHEQNLLNYRKVLSETTDPAKRQTVLQLLASEEANIRPLTKAK